MTRAVVLLRSIVPSIESTRTVQRKYSYGGSASSSYGTLLREGYAREARALSGDTRHMGIFQPKLAALVAGGSGL